MKNAIFEKEFKKCKKCQMPKGSFIGSFCKEHADKYFSIEDKPKKIKPVCFACGSGQVYLRLTNQEYICRMCGSNTKKKAEGK